MKGRKVRSLVANIILVERACVRYLFLFHSGIERLVLKTNFYASEHLRSRAADGLE